MTVLESKVRQTRTGSGTVNKYISSAHNPLNASAYLFQTMAPVTRSQTRTSPATHDRDREQKTRPQAPTVQLFAALALIALVLLMYWLYSPQHERKHQHEHEHEHEPQPNRYLVEDEAAHLWGYPEFDDEEMKMGWGQQG
ncbi:hypothetical protein AC578_4041 [Pseudocercospora eumusae]|uniref:Uncharacterized protein n=1 Tax=Pseudocercospora eumusae TaxID=321146 RepID=A0A139HE12_9PEZI|nr:hypothetical protein AC578_4041 [Pseudocercospora eumusae]